MKLKNIFSRLLATITCIWHAIFSIWQHEYTMGLNLSKMNKLHVQLKYARSIPELCVHDSQTIGQLEKTFSFGSTLLRWDATSLRTTAEPSNWHVKSWSRLSSCRPTTKLWTFNNSRLLMRYQLSGTTKDRPRPGQPRMTTPRQDIFIRQRHLRERFLTSSSTAKILLGRHG